MLRKILMVLFILFVASSCVRAEEGPMAQSKTPSKAELAKRAKDDEARAAAYKAEYATRAAAAAAKRNAENEAAARKAKLAADNKTTLRLVLPTGNTSNQTATAKQLEPSSVADGLTRESDGTFIYKAHRYGREQIIQVKFSPKKMNLEEAWAWFNSLGKSDGTVLTWNCGGDNLDTIREIRSIINFNDKQVLLPADFGEDIRDIWSPKDFEHEFKSYVYRINEDGVVDSEPVYHQDKNEVNEPYYTMVTKEIRQDVKK